MTFDFQLGHACPHLTIEEEVLLGSDRRELRTRQPVANANQVRITANDEITIPREGLYAQAQLFGASSGPFRIRAGRNLFSLQNRAQTLIDIPLPVGTRVPTSEVVRTLTSAIQNAGIRISVEEQDGYLVITDRLERGPRSRIRVSGTAAQDLGFKSQFRARGREVYPPWGFQETPGLAMMKNISGVKTISTRFPKFSKPIQGNPVFKVTYTTFQEQCRRCLGFGIENDYRIAKSGDPLQVRNEDLLNQGVLKILTTVKGSNPFHPLYGTTLLERIGIKAVGTGVSTINSDVSMALDIFTRTQEIQAKYQEVSPRERLDTVLGINTRPSPIDPTVFEVEIVASNASSQPVVVTTVFAAPGTAALAGSNGLSLGLEGFGVDPSSTSIPGVRSVSGR
jgi:phage baseplate assembly protein W